MTSLREPRLHNGGRRDRHMYLDRRSRNRRGSGNHRPRSKGVKSWNPWRRRRNDRQSRLPSRGVRRRRRDNRPVRWRGRDSRLIRGRRGDFGLLFLGGLEVLLDLVKLIERNDRVLGPHIAHLGGLLEIDPDSSQHE